MNEAIQALHPPRPTASRRRIRRSPSNDNSIGSSISSSHSTSSHHHRAPSTLSKKNSRFTSLLLEHGEKHLNDWAVQASSSADGLKFNRTEGRLRLCSRSIVFEPRHSSKGIVRVPFRYMKVCPSLMGGHMNSSDEEGALLVVTTDRHFVMKANNAIGPYKQIQSPAEFSFQFIHSSPVSMSSLSKMLYDAEKHGGAAGTILNENDNSKVLKQILNPTIEMKSLNDSIHFLHVQEHPLTAQMKGTMKQPLLEQMGVVLLTKYGLYFNPWNGVATPSTGRQPHNFWAIKDMKGIACRYDGLKDVALEIYLSKREGSDDKSMYQSILLSFESMDVRESVLRIILSQRQKEEGPTLPCFTDRSFVETALQNWQTGQLDNFSYLLVLNSAAGRSFHDLSRYPVFPWVLSNYGEETEDRYLDLENPNNYRDLSKPIGALNEERFIEFQKRYNGMVQQQRAMQEQGQKMSMQDSPFLYGTHYSSPGYVLFYLLRVMPEHMLCLQNGKFDVPDRLFHSMHSTFQSILSNPADVKELIPEFYDPDCFDFLINAMGLQLGNLQSGERVNDVLLPPWAKSTKHFLRLNRAALESDYCTQQLPKWIDLIFGVNSRGAGARNVRNLFHPVSYLSPSDVDAMESEEERRRVELQANEFGICPDQLFCKEHPRKDASWESTVGVVMSEGST